MYVAVAKNGIITQDSKIVSFRGETWNFDGVTHPRKLNVSTKDDPNGPDSYPNMNMGEYYPSVFDMGIWDVYTGSWSFSPGWDISDMTRTVEMLRARFGDPTDLTIQTMRRIADIHDKWSVRNNPELFGDLIKLVTSKDK